MTWPVDCVRENYKTQQALMDSVVNRNVADILIQYGPDGVIENAMCADLDGHHKYEVAWYDPVLKEQDLERVVDDLTMFHPHEICVLVIDGGEYIKEAQWGHIFGWVMAHDNLRVIVNTNDRDKIPYRVRVTAILSEFPPFKPPEPTKPKANDVYWYLNRFVENRQQLADADLWLGRKYQIELMRDIEVKTFRQYKRVAHLWEAAKKLRRLTKDSARKIVQHVIPVLRLSKAKSLQRRIQALDLSNQELGVLKYRKLTASKKSFKPPEPEVPRGADIAKYF